MIFILQNPPWIRGWQQCQFHRCGLQTNHVKEPRLRELTGAPACLSSLFGGFLLPGASRTQSAERASSSLECCSADKKQKKKKGGTVAVWRRHTRSAPDIAHCRVMIFIKPMWCKKTKTKKISKCFVENKIIKHLRLKCCLQVINVL